MTMRAIAGELGVPIPTLYRRLKAAGVNIADLRDETTGKVTPAGAAVIADLFRGSADDTAIQEVLNGDSHSVASDTKRRDGGETAAEAVLKVKLEAAESTISRLEDELRGLRSERDRLLTMLEAEQAQRVHLLESGRRRDDQRGDQRGGLFGWFRRRGRGE